ncbi:unnamed protein product [Rotaria sp. Silwood1]|nr:unnamed protein product [Rotaria sp. Silwood1]CAF1554298.1 unnamed protein product [Rotaria sp. Silwood1]
MDVLLDISSIFNFLVIVIDRYCIINYPFKYASLGKIKLLAFMISGIWIVSALISIPSILGWGQMDRRSSIQISQFLTDNTTSANVEQASEVLDKQKSTENSCSSHHSLLNVSNANTNTNRSSTCTPVNCCLSIFVSRRSSISRHVHSRNQQAIRTFGVMLGLFLICWLPLMLFAIIKPLYENITGPSRSLNVPSWVYSVLLWLPYALSMLRPLIYAKFNREFRTSFHEIICCHCKDLNEKIQQQEYLANSYGEN